MTPFPAPGAAAAAPRAPTPAGAPRPMMGSYGNLAAAVRVAPAPTPRAQGIPVARPRMPMPPHAQGAPIHGAPRPMVNLGVSAPSPTPRMQAVPRPATAPGIPPNNTRAVVPSARPQMPLLQPMQRIPAVANPAAPSTLKRGPAAPIQQAKRQAPMPRPQGAPPGGVPPPTNPVAAVDGARAPRLAQGAPPTRSGAPPPQLRKFGVYKDPAKGWMARVMDPTRRAARDVGPFADAHLAALAHDRAAVACAGRGIGIGAKLHFETSFYRVETAFLQRWEGDVCDALEKGYYEDCYAKFLKAGYKAALKVKLGDDGGEQVADGVDELIAKCVGDGEVFWDDIEDFFIWRAGEIGDDALMGEDGGKMLRTRFVEMHRNKSLCPAWRRNNRLEKIQMQQQQHAQMQQQQHTQMQQQQQIQIMEQQQQEQIQQQQQFQMQQQRQQQEQIQQQQQFQMQQQRQQQEQIQQQQQFQMQQQRQQQEQMQQQRQQQFQQQQMRIQKERQQQMMRAQQKQQYLDDIATLQVKQELCYSSSLQG